MNKANIPFLAGLDPSLIQALRDGFDSGVIAWDWQVFG